MGKGRGAELPSGLKAIVLYSIIVGLCYTFYLFVGIYNPDLLVLANLGSQIKIGFNSAILVLIIAMVIGIRQRKPWAYPLAMLWFLGSILLSLLSVFSIDTGALPAMKYLLWGMAIVVIAVDLLIVWYLTNAKPYLVHPKREHTFRGEKMFVRVLGGCWIALILTSAVLGFSFYQHTTALADTNIAELQGTTMVHAVVLCDTKEGQERDICYVVLATMHPEQDRQAICDRITSDFFKFTCYRTGAA